MIDKGIPRHGYEVADADGNIVGVVTSGTQSPSLNKAIGMAYVPAALSGIGNDIYIQVRGKSLKGTIVSLPFYKA
jgi:aminomethyltransferase